MVLAAAAGSLPAQSHAVTRSRLLCAQVLHYDLPVDLSFGLMAQPDGNDPAVEPGVRGVVALVHGTSRADKQWPLEHWIALGRQLIAHGYRIAQIGRAHV